MSKKVLDAIIVTIGLIGYLTLFVGVVCILWFGIIGVKIAISGWMVGTLSNFIIKTLHEVSK